jgi:hypothetical protein
VCVRVCVFATMASSGVQQTRRLLSVQYVVVGLGVHTKQHKTCLGTLFSRLPTASRCASASLTSWHRHSPSQYTRAGPRAARQAGRCHPGGEWHTPHHKAPSLNFWPLQTACTFPCHKSFLCCSDSQQVGSLALSHRTQSCCLFHARRAAELMLVTALV